MIYRAVAIALVLVGGCYGCNACDEDCHRTTCGKWICPGSPSILHCTVDGPHHDAGSCNLLTQAGCAVGEKCTWLVDALLPVRVGHIGCAPDGTGKADELCSFGAPGASGFDTCERGLVCSELQGAGICRSICDMGGGAPACDAQHACVTDRDLFATGSATPPAAGLCSVACDPLEDNDFDGSGSASVRNSTTCGLDRRIGCYGYPSFGMPPRTSWTCMDDINYEEAQPTGLRHRVRCSEANNCADAGPTFDVNSCNQGYLPLLGESSATISTVICVALCKPRNCFAGNCGVNDEDRLGEAPHRCANPDRVGSFDTSSGGEHCRFLWSVEVDQGALLPSSTSNSVGFCFDHGKYLYDSNADTTPDTPYPPCASLPDGFGSGGTLGAGDLGCVDSTHVQFATGKPSVLDGLRPLAPQR